MSESIVQYPGEALRSWLQQKEVQLSEEQLQLLVRIADTLFFASMGKEEGEVTRVRVAYHAQGIRGLQAIQEHVFVGDARWTRPAWELIPFESESTITEFGVKALVKLAPAANLPRTSIVVGPRDGQLRIQGLARRVEYSGFYDLEGEDSVFVFHAPEPGHLTLSCWGDEVFRYEQGGLVAPDVESVGQLTAVDNALLLGPNLEVLCAGFQVPTQGETPVVHEAESIQGELGASYAIGQHGSRHRAVAAFANRHPGGLVFVASQDGPLRCLHRPLERNEVLLWTVRRSDE